MEASGEASNVLIAEALDPVTATMIAAILVVLIFVIPIASVLTSAFSKSLVIVLATGLLSTAGFLISIYPHHPVAVPVGIGIQVGGLLLAIGGCNHVENWPLSGMHLRNCLRRRTRPLLCHTKNQAAISSLLRCVRV
jgi:hypothetical protein